MFFFELWLAGLSRLEVTKSYLWTEIYSFFSKVSTKSPSVIVGRLISLKSSAESRTTHIFQRGCSRESPERPLRKFSFVLKSNHKPGKPSLKKNFPFHRRMTGYWCIFTILTRPWAKRRFEVRKQWRLVKVRFVKDRKDVARIGWALVRNLLIQIKKFLSSHFREKIYEFSE